MFEVIVAKKTNRVICVNFGSQSESDESVDLSPVDMYEPSGLFESGVEVYSRL